MGRSDIVKGAPATGSLGVLVKGCMSSMSGLYLSEKQIAPMVPEVREADRPNGAWLAISGVLTKESGVAGDSSRCHFLVVPAVQEQLRIDDSDLRSTGVSFRRGSGGLRPAAVGSIHLPLL